MPHSEFVALARLALKWHDLALGGRLRSDQQLRLFRGLPVSPYILFPCVIGEGGLCLWLLVAGVNKTKWCAIVGDTFFERGKLSDSAQNLCNQT